MTKPHTFTAEPGSQLASLRIECHNELDRLKATGLTESNIRKTIGKMMGVKYEYVHFGMFNTEQCVNSLDIMETIK